MQSINKKLLVSGAEYFNDSHAINAYMDEKIPVNTLRAIREHAEIVKCFQSADIEVIKAAAPQDCQDGVYTANWGLVVGKKVIMSNLPNKRKDEEAYAESVFQQLGLQIEKLPSDIKFSGQGDALVCGKYIFVGSQYRTDREAWSLIEDITKKHVIGVETVPQLDEKYKPVTNPVTGWPDSFFYDLDLALAVIDSETIAWCPQAFTPESREIIKAMTELNQIEVSINEAKNGFACNLVSTGKSVVMSNKAPELQKELENRGLEVITPEIIELLKGGGFIRCVSLTL